MRKRPPQEREGEQPTRPERIELPAPSNSFRRRAWLEFQRALDPLAAPRRLRQPQR